MVDRTFLWHVGLTIVIAGAGGALLLSSLAGEEVLLAFGVGAGLSVLNAVVGTFSAGYAFDKSQTRFMKIVLGGMMVRMGVLLALLFVLIKFAELHVLSLTMSLFGFYLIFLVMEIFSIQRLVEGRSA
ncbi:MAG: ATP synthase subunit I [Ignavibacteria bacterium]|nr:ATP synthase subunit I [Ignavibacteria bacterium]